ncbi:HAMP domain-containing protein [Ktedonobacteria bacterium brp13]|nr:HAMP domain-containing protein [Ktedonobacteria bacterium brp13]
MRVRSLRMRLMLTIMVVVLIALGIFAVFASHITKNGLQSYISTQQAEDQKIITNLQKTYHQSGTSQTVQRQVEQNATEMHARIIVIDHNQHIIADSAHQLVGQSLTIPLFLTLDNDSRMNTAVSPFPGSQPPPSHSVRIISTDGSIVTFGQPAPALNATLLDSVNHTLSLTVLVAGLVALVLTIMLSGAILKPVHALTLAARRMEQGDLSQRVKVKKKDEIGDLAHAFNTMAESLAHSEQLHRNLLSDIAHELRTPLTNIRGYLEALQDQVIEPGPMVIVSLHEEAMLLSRLITDLQDLALAEASQLHLHCMPIALEDSINHAVNGLLMQASNKHLSLVVDLPSDLPLVNADHQRVGQILRNLLSNAIKHTPPEGTIQVSAQVVQREVEVRIQDTGVGIAAEHLPYLFKRFYRADPSRARMTGGTGLGLAIVEQLVHVHGGHIKVESQVGQGTCFTFTLPIALL